MKTSMALVAMASVLFFGCAVHTGGESGESDEGDESVEAVAVDVGTEPQRQADGCWEIIVCTGGASLDTEPDDYVGDASCRSYGHHTLLASWAARGGGTYNVVDCQQ